MKNTSNFICTLTTIVDGRPPFAKKRLADTLSNEKNSEIIKDNNPNIIRRIEYALSKEKNLVLDCSPETANNVIKYLNTNSIPYVKEKYIAVMNDNELDYLSTVDNLPANVASNVKDDVHSLIGGLYALSEKEEFKVCSVHVSDYNLDTYSVVAESIHTQNKKLFAITNKSELLNPDDWKIAEKLEITKNNLNRNITQTNTSEPKNTPKTTNRR